LDVKQNKKKTKEKQLNSGTKPVTLRPKLQRTINFFPQTWRYKLPDKTL